MDLINREDAFEALGEMPENWTDSPEEVEAVNSWCAAVEAINSAPSVAAVPLDKLCDMLSKYLGNPPCPCGYDLKGTSCNPDWAKKECWHNCLTTWMEEQDD